MCSGRLSWLLLPLGGSVRPVESTSWYAAELAAVPARPPACERRRAVGKKARTTDKAARTTAAGDRAPRRAPGPHHLPRARAAGRPWPVWYWYQHTCMQKPACRGTTAAARPAPPHARRPLLRRCRLGRPQPGAAAGQGPRNSETQVRSNQPERTGRRFTGRRLAPSRLSRRRAARGASLSPDRSLVVMKLLV